MASPSLVQCPWVPLRIWESGEIGEESSCDHLITQVLMVEGRCVQQLRVWNEENTSGQQVI